MQLVDVMEKPIKIIEKNKAEPPLSFARLSMLSAPRWSTAPLTPPLIEQATVEASEPTADPVCWRRPGGEHREVR